jgi:hypothetical protein
MTKKIAKKKVETKPQSIVMKVFPDRGVIGALADIALVTILLSGSFMMVVAAVMMAGKITITAGK